MKQNTSTYGDGMIRWTEPIEVSVATGLIEIAKGEERPGPIALHYQVPPGEAPLEIGSSLPSRTMLHLLDGGKVARWPYRHSEFRLFINLSRHRHTNYL